MQMITRREAVCVLSSASALAFLNTVRGGAATATCMPLHVGRSTIVVQSNLTDDRGKLVAQVTQTQAVLAAPGVDAAAK